MARVAGVVAGSVRALTSRMVWRAGLVPVAELAQRLRAGERFAGMVMLFGWPRPAAGSKALTVIGSVLAGGGCIDDVDLLRSVALPELFDEVRALRR